MPDNHEPPTAIEQELDIVALGKRAVALVLADPLVHVGAGVLLVAGSAVSVTVLTGPLLVGYVRMVKLAIAGEPIDFQHLGLGFTRPWAPLLSWLVYALSVLLLLCAFVLPGLFLAVAWMFAFWYVALDDCLASESLKRAWALTRRAPGVVLVIALTVVLANLIGVLTLVGGLFSVPVSLAFMTLCFRELEPSARRAT